MKLRELTDREQMVLVALTQHVAGADGVLSEDEADTMEYLSEEMGEEEWQVAYDRVSGMRNTKAGAVELAQQVSRREAQTLILAMLEMVAESDGVTPEERELLDQIAGAWDA